MAGGIELAAALVRPARVAAKQRGVPVAFERRGRAHVDGGTTATLIGHSNALDLMLTGRPVSGEEAQRMGLANRLVAPGSALEAAVELAQQLAAFPQTCLRQDRLSSYEQWGLEIGDALRNEYRRGWTVLESNEAREGATRFAAGEGRHGKF